MGNRFNDRLTSLFGIDGLKAAGELIIILGGLTIICLLIFELMYFKPLRTLIAAGLALLFSLFASHIFLYMRRQRYSSEILRLIDYIYLAAASVGLLSAFQYDAELIKKDTASFNDWIKIADAGADHSLKIATAERCRQHSNDDYLCQAGNTELELIESARKGGRESLRSQYEHTIANKWINDLSPSAVGSMNSYLRFTNELKGYESTARQISPEWKSRGIILLMIALGLRIARVSVELFGWARV